MGSISCVTVRVEVRKGKAIVIDEMPYDALPGAGEAEVVDRATMTAEACIKNRM